METLQILQRNYKGWIIRQRSDNKFLCATDLLNLYNSNTNGGSKKIIADFLSGQDFREHIQALADDINQTMGNSIVLKTTQPTDLFNVKTGRNGGTWMHELSFLKFAMWLSKEFEIWALKILRDNLVEFRLNAGDKYKEMCFWIKEKLKPDDKIVYQMEAVMINEVALGVMAISTRNILSPKDLDRLNKAQEINAKLLQKGILNREERRRKLKEFFNLYY